MFNLNKQAKANGLFSSLIGSINRDMALWWRVDFSCGFCCSCI